MKALLLNRIALLLAFAGIFVAGTLSLAHYLHLDVPCGPQSSCAEVTRDKAASLVNVPVAYFGLLAYFFLATLAVMRAANGMKSARVSILAGTAASLVGTAFSAYLTYEALFRIKATCWWCLASASIMLLTLIVYLLMMRAPEPEGEPSDLDFKLMFGLGILTTVALVIAKGYFGGDPVLMQPIMSQDKLQGLRIEELSPKDAPIEGVHQAPVTIVEFGDLTCTYCRRVFPEVRKIVSGSNGKIRLIFRHLPLWQVEEHKHSLYAAFLAEVAAEKGKLFDFIAAIYSFEDPLEPQQMLQIAAQLGVDPKVIGKRFDDENDPAWARVTRDLTYAQSILRIDTTPVFIVYAEGVKERMQAKSIEALQQIIATGAIAERLKKP